MRKELTIYVGGFDKLGAEILAEYVNIKRLNLDELRLVVECTKRFDEWEIENYIEQIKLIKPDVVEINVADEITTKPTLRQIIELQGALEHFAKLENYDSEKKCQIYTSGQMRILFWSEYIE